MNVIVVDDYPSKHGSGSGGSSRCNERVDSVCFSGEFGLVTSHSASKGAKGGGAGLFDNHWWSPTKDKFDVCAVADPVGNQIEILGGQSPSLEHASWVYSGFADAVKGYNSGGK